MLWLIRAGAYLVSGFTVWHFFQGGGGESFSFARHLALDSTHSMILGVCAGVSNYTGVDVSMIRLVWVLSCLYKGLGIALYILAFLILPLN